VQLWNEEYSPEGEDTSVDMPRQYVSMLAHTRVRMQILVKQDEFCFANRSARSMSL